MYNWKNTIVGSSATIKDAADILTKEALRIVMVVNDNECLVGTVTDGDIRRALVNGIDINSLVTGIMKTKPVTATVNDSKEKIANLMMQKRLLQVPILNSDNRIVGLEVIDRITKKSTHDNVVVIMAGGFGSRLYPLTEDTPKPLLNVGSQPILETIIKQFVKSGFHNFYISTHFKSELIRDYFKKGDRLGVSIKYINEKVPLGTAGALGLLPSHALDLPIIVTNGDLLTNIDFNNLLDFHNNSDTSATMCVREYDFQVPFGVIDIKEDRVSKITEKPVHNFFVNAGVYVLNRGLVRNLDGKSKLDMTDLLSSSIDNKQLGVFPIHEYWLDIGRMSEYKKANEDIANIFE